MFPDMSNVIAGFTETTRFRKATRVPIDGDAVETLAAPVEFQAVLEPLKTQRLLIKPEGERRWKWFQIWTEQELMLGDVVDAFDGKTYKVMSKDDWSRAGYYAYELTERENV